MYTLQDLTSKQKSEQAPSNSIGLPEFETMVILATLQQTPGLEKSKLVRLLLNSLGRKFTEERIFLKYIDILVNLNYVVRHDFLFYLTPVGVKRLKVLREQNHSALMILAFNQF